MSASQSIPGLASGLDTASIVEALMKVERRSYDRVSEKVEIEKIKLQAYQSVNSMLSSLKSSVANLSSSSFWNAKATSSSNESSLTATASQYAAEGSYSLRVAQLATSTQFMSTGYSSATSKVISSSSGSSTSTITLESSKARVDSSAKLEDLNGGKGVYRGSIRITDASGATTTVDVSTCETIDQVATAINNAAGVQIQASIRTSDDGNGSGDRLEIVDTSGGSGSLKIQNVGQGTTATDLGIAGVGATAGGVHSIIGSSIYYMGNTTSLSSLNDGLGIEQGMMCITVKGAQGSMDIYADMTEAETVGDILNAVNSAIKAAAESDANAAALLGDLKLSLNADKNGFTFTGGQAGNVYTVSELYGQDENGTAELGQPQTASQLGLLGTFTPANDGDSFGGTRLMGDVNSPMLGNLSGANLTGVGSESSLPTVSADTLTAGTKLSELNGGKGVTDLGEASTWIQLAITEAGIGRQFGTTDLLDSDKLRALITNSESTLGDLVNFLNDAFANSGSVALKDVTINIDSAAKGLYFDGLSGVYDYQFAGSLVTSLGLVYTGSGNDANGWGAGIEGVVPSDVQDLYDDAFAICKNDSGNDAMILPTTLMNTLYEGGVTQLDSARLGTLLADGLTINVGSNTFTVDFSSLDPDTMTALDFYSHINASIAEQAGAAGLDSAPFLEPSLTSFNFTWCNVDLGEDFSVSGGIAAAFGIDKTYVGATQGTVTTSVQTNLNPVTTGTAVAKDVAGADLLNSLNAGSGLTLTGSSLTLTFGPDGSSTTVSVSREDILGALGGSAGAATLDQYVAALNSLFSDAIDASSLNGSGASVTFGLSDDGKGITVLNAAGTAEGEQIVLGGSMATASSTGLTAATMVGGAAFESPEAADIRGVDTTPVAVGGVGYITMEIGGSTVTLNTNGLSQSSTLNDLIYTLNKQLSDLGYANMSFGVSDSGSGIAFTNDSNGDVTFKYDAVSSLASDLGLVGTAAEKTDKTVGANSHSNGATLNRNYMSRATQLSALNNGEGADQGVIEVTNALGTSVKIDISDAKTVGDVLDAINGLLYGVKARINDAGDGIIIEQTESKGTGAIKVSSTDGSKTAEHLGLAGSSTKGEDGVQRLDGSMKTVIEIGANDTLTDIMNRISTMSTGYKASIINDGTGANSHRLSIQSASTGSGHDFIIDSDILAMQQVTRGQDSMVLYGNPDSGMSPVALKSSSNSNNQAILGLTLELNAVSDTYTTINVTTDTEKVVEEIQNMVQAYNDLSDLITYLDSYDPVNEQDGILKGDSTVRSLMDQIESMFYQVFNPNNLTSSEIYNSGVKSTWTWMDLGISFSTNNSNEDGESGYWYSRMELDLDMLSDMVTNNWDDLKSMLYNQTNVSDSTLAASVAATSMFNYQKEYDEDGNLVGEYDDPNQAINGDKSSSNFGVSNGITGNKTIEEGENQYTVYFQGTVSLDRVTIYHPSSGDYPASEYALKDFIVEYLDPKTGQWEKLREISGNSSSSTVMGLTNLQTSGIRITASSTNAEDGKFRLLDVQCLESNGLANQLNKTVNELTDVVDGFFTNANADVETKISELKEQMTKMEERLTAKEDALWRKFNAMETILSQLQSQSSTFSSLFSSLNSNSSSSSK